LYVVGAEGGGEEAALLRGRRRREIKREEVGLFYCLVW
jgi:hypothetical protein